ncbi:MAG: helix-turn-helix domain-containing protein, partial [Anaerolineales bacterium]|nr:helix-turn-helix domain-containing protein [Anaerolineales bacterium]
KEKSLSQKEAAKILGVNVRHVRRLFKAYLEKGAAGLVSQRRGRESNNRLSEATRVQALDLLGSKYRGFGPTLACEKLVEVEGLKISNESVRKMMMAEGLWKARRVRKIVTHQMRERRPCLGELVQIDGSPHDWFEGRAPGCVLLVFIDDASGNLLRLQFVGSESFFSYSASAQAYFERCGKPAEGLLGRSIHGFNCFKNSAPSSGVNCGSPMTKAKPMPPNSRRMVSAACGETVT